MNPRVSRSSALASKATGYPIAKIAAKLAVGYTLDELKNDITQTSAAFEPVIDYVVVKWPRFAFEKFPGADATLGTQMKSVGEVMSIGRTFCEALQKAARSLETGKDGLVSLLGKVDYRAAGRAEAPARSRRWRRPTSSCRAHRRRPTRRRRCERSRSSWPSPRPSGSSTWPTRCASASRDEELTRLTAIDPWFLAHVRRIVDAEGRLSARRRLGPGTSARASASGFSDRQIATLTGSDEDAVRGARLASGTRAVYARVDTCAAEFVAHTPYLYSTYETESESQPRRDAAQGRHPRRRSRTASGRGSSSTTAACTPSWPCASWGSRP